jgi:hypothetical protein
MSVTMIFALLASIMPMFLGVSGGLGLIPLCFMVIPAVHFFSRELLRPRPRIADLEKRLEER